MLRNRGVPARDAFHKAKSLGARFEKYRATRESGALTASEAHADIKAINHFLAFEQNTNAKLDKLGLKRSPKTSRVVSIALYDLGVQRKIIYPRRIPKLLRSWVAALKKGRRTESQAVTFLLELIEKNKDSKHITLKNRKVRAEFKAHYESYAQNEAVLRTKLLELNESANEKRVLRAIREKTEHRFDTQRAVLRSFAKSLLGKISTEEMRFLSRVKKKPTLVEQKTVEEIAAAMYPDFKKKPGFAKERILQELRANAVSAMALSFALRRHNAAANSLSRIQRGELGTEDKLLAAIFPSLKTPEKKTEYDYLKALLYRPGNMKYLQSELFHLL